MPTNTARYTQRISDFLWVSKAEAVGAENKRKTLKNYFVLPKKIPATSENSRLNANDKSIGNRLLAQRVLLQGLQPQEEIEFAPIVIKKHKVPA